MRGRGGDKGGLEEGLEKRRQLPACGAIRGPEPHLVEEAGVGPVSDPRHAQARVRHRSVDRPELVVAQRAARSEEHTSELQSQSNLVCRLLLEKKKRDDWQAS